MTAWSIAADLRTCLTFCTCLPLARKAALGGSELARASWAFPVVGALVGGAGGLGYWLAFHIGLAPAPAAALALAGTLGLTGCLHEDGLADTADALGGDSRDRKLAIMRDSRLGSYGACALALSLLLRWSALAAIARPEPVALALVAAHGGARAALPAFMWIMPRARADGLAVTAGRPPATAAAAAAVLGAALLFVSFGIAAAIAGTVLLAAAGWLTSQLALRQFGGQTGDVLGAIEQIGEVIVLLLAAILARATP